MRVARFGLAVLAFHAPGIFLQAQTGPQATLIVSGAVEHSLRLGLADLAQMRRSTVETKGRDGAVIYEGVLLADLMQAAGVPAGEKLRGADLTACLLATARDGYRVVFSLAELDAAFTDSKVLVADRMNGKPLPGGQGPLKLVAPQDKRAARSVRELERLEVVRVSR